MNSDSDKNSLIYLLAGFGLGALIGALAGLLLAPKSGEETRGELETKVKDLKGKTEEWLAEQRSKRLAAQNTVDAEEIGA
jgi:gas vesicle protein